jgi:ubiquinone/menaquinone biosynthesis C-methylase UbiE
VFRAKVSHSETVSGFGDEWSRFDQEELSGDELQKIFNDYFKLFPWDLIDPEKSTGIDVGCGSGRWARLVVSRVGTLHMLDASQEALNVAKNNLKKNSSNVFFHHASVEQIPVQDETLDFAYSLGVLHHVPDTGAGIKSIYKKLKPGAPFLLYLYYSFDNQPFWYRGIFKLSDLVRKVISRMPNSNRYICSQIIALFIYWPLSRFGYVLDKFRIMPSSWPLEYYKDKSFYVMRTDALDRFGTQLEQRFSKVEIEEMLELAGFDNIEFSQSKPYWCVIAFKPN